MRRTVTVSPTKDDVGLVEAPVEAEGAVFHDAAFGLAQEQVLYLTLIRH